MLQADVDQIRALADKLLAAGGAIDSIDVRTSAAGLHSAVPGSDIPRAIELAAEFVEGAYLRVAERLREVANKSKDAAGNLQTSDQQFAQMMHAMDVHRA
ncbi:hypothetical protein [Nocardia asiatica]|uniref:hypothetical protein n=1 Tax=Nocardia asiatica TaxID=209252 RepID=UPI002457C98E|nr:hypothetical protein [Nocardia asiatica]